MNHHHNTWQHMHKLVSLIQLYHRHMQYMLLRQYYMYYIHNYMPHIYLHQHQHHNNQLDNYNQNQIQYDIGYYNNQYKQQLLWYMIYILNYKQNISMYRNHSILHYIDKKYQSMYEIFHRYMLYISNWYLDINQYMLDMYQLNKLALLQYWQHRHIQHYKHMSQD